MSILWEDWRRKAVALAEGVIKKAMVWAVPLCECPALQANKSKAHDFSISWASAATNLLGHRQPASLYLCLKKEAVPTKFK